jgi:hypothetical protein
MHLSSSAHNPPAPGFIRAVQRITKAIHLNRDQPTWNAAIQYFDESRTLLNEGCATATAERI